MKRALTIAAAVAALFAIPHSALADGGPAGVWKLDEGHGTVAADSSGYGDNGTLLGGASWTAGPAGGALRFDTPTARVLVPNVAQLEPATAVTVSAWVRSAGSPGEFRYIVGKGANGCTAASYALYTGPNGGLQFYVSENRGAVFRRSPDAGNGVWDGHWHQVVGTFDGQTIRLYVDGVEVGDGTQYPGHLEYLLPNYNDLFIGNYLGCQSKNFAGSIGEVAIWGRALSTAEVTALGRPSGETGPGGVSPGPGGGIPPVKHSPNPPAVSVLSMSRWTLRGPAPTIDYIDTQAARTTFVIIRLQNAVRRGKRCVAIGRGTRIQHAIRCTLVLTVARLSHRDRIGENSFRFTQVRRFKLAAARYVLQLTPSARGRVGTTLTIPFSVGR